jgi:STE24 endopeptidase
VGTSTTLSSPDPLRQREARSYGRFRRRLEAADALLGLVLALVGALAGSWLADTLDTPGPLILDVAVWLFVVGAAAELGGLPLSVIRYRRSRREGLSRQVPAAWLRDRAKGLVLGFVVGVPAVTALVALQRALPHGWWLPAALGAAALELVLATAGPVLILPLFLRSRPLDPGPLADDLVDLAHRAGVRVSSMRVLEAGAKTSAGNAFVSGLGPTRRIMIFDTLIGENGAPDAERIREMRAVLAHELGHARAFDLWRGLALGAASALAAFGFAEWLLGVMPTALVHDGPGSLSALPALALALGVAYVPLGILAAAHSRRRERAADAFSVRTARDGEALARALERMCAQNLSELEPPPLYVALRMSHPAPFERIAAARSRGKESAARSRMAHA